MPELEEKFMSGTNIHFHDCRDVGCKLHTRTPTSFCIETTINDGFGAHDITFFFASAKEKRLWLEKLRYQLNKMMEGGKENPNE